MKYKSQKRKYLDINSDSEEEEQLDVTFIDNHIYMYCSMTIKVQQQFIKIFRTVQNNIQRFDMENTIYIHIHSEGGNIYVGFALMDILLKSKVKTIAIVEGQASSAASLVVLGCTYRTITENSFMLIHQLASNFWGKANQFEDESKNIKDLSNRLVVIYKNFTKLNSKKIEKVLKHDIYWDSQKCLEFGLIDEIL
jgi:ATP-dependent protease ClpP protease subunit